MLLKTKSAWTADQFGLPLQPTLDNYGAVFADGRIPLSAPGFVTLIVVNALWVWNELLIALVFLQDDGRRTLMAGQRFFVRGLVAGAVT